MIDLSGQIGPSLCSELLIQVTLINWKGYTSAKFDTIDRINFLTIESDIRYILILVPYLYSVWR